MLQADATSNSSTCSSLTSGQDDGYYIQATLALSGEDTLTFNLAKQRKLKGALAQILDVDVSDISIMGVNNVTANTTGIASSSSSNSSSTDVAKASGNTAIRASTVSGGNATAAGEGDLDLPPDGQGSTSDAAAAGEEATSESLDASGDDSTGAGQQETDSSMPETSSGEAQGEDLGVFVPRPAAAGAAYHSWEGVASEGEGDGEGDMADNAADDAGSQLPQKRPGYVRSGSGGPASQPQPTPVPAGVISSGSGSVGQPQPAPVPAGVISSTAGDQPVIQAGAPPSRKRRALQQADSVAADVGGGGHVKDQSGGPVPGSVAELLLVERNQLAAARGDASNEGEAGGWRSPLHGLLEDVMPLPEFLAQAVMLAGPPDEPKQRVQVDGEAAGGQDALRQCEAGICSQQSGHASRSFGGKEEMIGTSENTATQRRLSMLELDEDGDWQQSGTSVDSITPDIGTTVMPTISFTSSGNVVIEINESAVASNLDGGSSSSGSEPSSSTGEGEPVGGGNTSSGSSPGNSEVNADPATSISSSNPDAGGGTGVLGDDASSSGSSHPGWLPKPQGPVDVGNADDTQFGISEGPLNVSILTSPGESSNEAIADPANPPAISGSEPSDISSTSAGSTVSTEATQSPQEGDAVSASGNSSSSSTQQTSAASLAAESPAMALTGSDVSIGGSSSNSTDTSSGSNNIVTSSSNDTDQTIAVFDSGPGSIAPQVMEAQPLGQDAQASSAIHPALESLLAPPVTYGPMPTGSKGKPASAAAPKWQPVNLGYGFNNDITSLVASEDDIDVAAVPKPQKPTVVAAAAGGAAGAKPPSVGQQFTAEELQQRLGKAQVYEDPEEGVVHVYSINRGLLDVEAQGSSSPVVGQVADSEGKELQGVGGAAVVAGAAAAPTKGAKIVAKVGLSPFVKMHHTRLVKPAVKVSRVGWDAGAGDLHDMKGPEPVAGGLAAGSGSDRRHQGDATQRRRSRTVAGNALAEGKRVAASEDHQQPLLHPVRTAGSRRKRSAEAAAVEHAIAVLQVKRGQLLKEEGHQVQGNLPGRTLLQVNSTSGGSARNSSVEVIVRVQGKVSLQLNCARDEWSPSSSHVHVYALLCASTGRQQ